MPSPLSHAPHAKDPRLPRAIHTFHALLSGFNAGAFWFCIIPSFTLLRRAMHLHRLPILSVYRLLRTTAHGTVFGLLWSCLTLSIWKKEEEAGLQDYNWKNFHVSRRGQIQGDCWTLGGAALGAGAGAALWRGRMGGGVRRLSGAGLGTVVGTVGYLVSGYGFGLGKATEDGEVVTW